MKTFRLLGKVTQLKTGIKKVQITKSGIFCMYNMGHTEHIYFNSYRHDQTINLKLMTTVIYLRRHIEK
jgi:hypothetical protein